MGFSKINYRDNEAFLEEIECPICLDILNSPVLIQQCQHRFCQNCLVDKIKKCPTCRIPFSHKKDLRSDRNTKNLILKLLFKCENTKCDIILQLEDLLKHSQLCNYNEVVCEKCDAKFLKNEAETHRAICDIKMQMDMKVRELKEQSTQ